MSSSRVHLSFALVVLFGGVLSGCAASEWRRAQAADTAEAYRAFLRNHPTDPASEAALLALGDKEFEAASKQHTVLAYKRFLQEFPDSLRAADARALLEGLRFNAAKERGTAEAWRQFLRDHPDGAHRAEAERALAEAEFVSAGPEADAAALKRLVREHPDDPRRAELQLRLDDEAYARAVKEGAFALYAYLRDQPAGAHREEVHAELLRLRLQGLLFSGRLDDVREALTRTPLATKLEDVARSLEEAERTTKVLAAADQNARRALPGYYLRGLEDLKRALSSPDPLDRWQAAQELGQHVTVDAIDPLIDAFRSARNPLIRQRAFDSLAAVLRAMPKRLSDYEIASRLEVLRPNAGSPELWVVAAALLDLSGRLEEAATEYQRAYAPQLPDPVILRRWVEIRLERKQPFSAAVAARQLALWAGGVAEDFGPSSGGRVSVADARQLCAAAVNARYALEVIQTARGQTTEFPEDLGQFELVATDASRLTEARLRDAELVLRTQDPNARTCADDRVGERVAAGARERAEALRALKAAVTRQAKPDVAAAVFEQARTRDPSPEIRATAEALR